MRLNDGYWVIPMWEMQILLVVQGWAAGFVPALTPESLVHPEKHSVIHEKGFKANFSATASLRRRATKCLFSFRWKGDLRDDPSSVNAPVCDEEIWQYIWINKGEVVMVSRQCVQCGEILSVWIFFLHFLVMWFLLFLEVFLSFYRNVLKLLAVFDTLHIVFV